ncbi:hypothetical protein JYG34_12010 [Pseudomonas entomophila]|uniref:hypothetical protein n=1 Tax=Pseudomonas entomophila TaxID=312306 RepID=UPI001BCBE492|nr:hypothetical protein [Pseudomonas entomophila]QVM93693.1 hypothetical protein JYG34_12010 [Pseudomonas entomophila]
MADTSFAVTGIFSGLQIVSTGVGGLVNVASSVSAQTGYAIARQQTSDGTPYTLLTAANTQAVSDPASLVVSAQYAQIVTFAELDLEVRYTDIPADTQVSVDATNPKLAVSRQDIAGTSLLGKQSKKQEAFEMDLSLNLWVARPEQLKTTSSITLSLSSIDGGSGGPVKKTLLQKVQINLSK